MEVEIGIEEILGAKWSECDYSIGKGQALWGLSDHANDFCVYSTAKGQQPSGFKCVMKCTSMCVHTRFALGMTGTNLYWGKVTLTAV